LRKQGLLIIDGKGNQQELHNVRVKFFKKISCVKRNQTQVVELPGNFTNFVQMHRTNLFGRLENGDYYLASYKNFRSFFQKREIELVIEVTQQNGIREDTITAVRFWCHAVF